jgi:putative dimethyl sulfoxide reductase chaperone
MNNRREGEGTTRGEYELTVQNASWRAAMYDLLVDVFVGLPDEALLSEIKDGRFDALHSAKRDLDGQRIHDGTRLVASCRSYVATGSPDVLVKELSVDRTMLLRASGAKNLRPPYERLYVTDPAEDGSMLQELNRFYRKAGLLLEEGPREPPDFLFVELDFMKQLCLREAKESLSGRSAGTTRAIEREFLREHIGKWAGVYCVEAEKHARTDFYRGFLAVLDGFIAVEMVHLEE